MNVIKGSVVYKIHSRFRLYIANSRIISALNDAVKSSYIFNWFVIHEDKDNLAINNSRLFRGNDRDVVSEISKDSKTISEAIRIPFIANSFFVKLILTFLECEDDDRNT